MLVLGIDTSSRFLGLGLWNGQGLADKILEDGGLTHSERLLPKMVDLLEKNGVDIKDIDKVVVTIGPGSFTGIRIGVATANAISLGLEIPVVGISTLEAMAYGVKDYNDLIICTMDAQRECFYTLFLKFENGKLCKLSKEVVSTKEEIIDFAKKYEKVMLLGDGLRLWEDMPEFITRGKVFSPDPLVVCEIGAKKEPEVDFAEPVYIRKSQAEVEYEQRNGC